MPLNELKLVHIKSSQKLPETRVFIFFIFLFFAYILSNVLHKYFSAMLWFDLFKVLKSISFRNPWKITSHFSFCQIFFCCKLLNFTHFSVIFSKLPLFLQLIRYYHLFRTQYLLSVFFCRYVHQTWIQWS